VANELSQGCVAFEEELSALIDDELAPAREAEVRAHVDDCDRCALRLQELCNVDLELAGLAQPSVSPALERGLAARIAAEATAARETSGPSAGTRSGRAAAPPSRRRWLEAPALRRAAVAAGLVLAAWLMLRGDDARPPEPGIAERPIAPSPPLEPSRQELIAERPAPPQPERIAERPEPSVAPSRPPQEEVVAAVPEPAAGPVAALTELPAAGPVAALTELPVEDLAMLLELEEVEDLDLIANLELLETLVALGGEAG